MSEICWQYFPTPVGIDLTQFFLLGLGVDDILSRWTISPALFSSIGDLIGTRLCASAVWYPVDG